MSCLARLAQAMADEIAITRGGHRRTFLPVPNGPERRWQEVVKGTGAPMTVGEPITAEEVLLIVRDAIVDEAEG
jgi:hypothetical protein